MRHVLVHGPMACGKTHNKAAIAKALGCTAIVDGVGLAEFKHLSVDASEKTLYLTCVLPSPASAAIARRADVVAFDDAMRIAGLQS